MKILKYKTRISLLITIAAIALTLICLLAVYSFHTGEEATVGIFSLAATLVGTIFIAVELKNGSDVTCSEMLINLNNSFHESDRLMLVYEILESGNPNNDNFHKLWKDVPCVAIAQYCTFFENLYLLYRHHIASIEDLDDLFGYRFFLFVNNPYIQEHYILPTSSSYVQIFELYKLWMRHRKDENHGDNGWQRHVPGSDYCFSEDYLERKLFLYDHGTTGYNQLICTLPKGASMRRLGFDRLSELMRLQQKVVEGMGDKSLFYPLSRDEMIESIHLDYVAGIVNDKDQIVAVCVLVTNRAGGRSLANELKMSEKSVITFDAVAVDSEWRGQGFQKRFIAWAKDMATQLSVDYILATVSPDNLPSKRNFLNEGFEVKSTKTKYDGLVRDILCLKIEK